MKSNEKEKDGKYTLRFTQGISAVYQSNLWQNAQMFK